MNRATAPVMKELRRDDVALKEPPDDGMGWSEAEPHGSHSIHDSALKAAPQNPLHLHSRFGAPCRSAKPWPCQPRFVHDTWFPRNVTSVLTVEDSYIV